ncbi:hypothetical protein [Frigoriglobus tundricola]|uniref:Uncharacterized protein n=1 Tax=Frigoriglobus tundricola TaxID=2774151 RepID=A0A6M5YX18_9BACT|nr:hypothetical protein [Frigoriglobus tundricola]QJW98535.1 hypothetical protein FTUN_6127 [Frigoriglobus tundricola]
MDLKILGETAAALFAEHALVGWTFGLTAAKRRLGVCKYRCKCPAREPLVTTTVDDAAKCGGRGTVHRRSRRPKAGVWRCKCPHRFELAWTFVSEARRAE